MFVASQFSCFKLYNESTTLTVSYRLILSFERLLTTLKFSVVRNTPIEIIDDSSWKRRDGNGSVYRVA